MIIKYKKLHPDAICPTYGTPGSAGLDLYALLDRPINIMGNLYEHSKVNNASHTHKALTEPVHIRTGIALEIPDGYVGLIRGRSGLAFKRGILSFDGTIDSDYRNEVMCMLYNIGRSPILIKPGDRICQIVIMPYLQCSLQESDTLEATYRGMRGIGSTGR